MGKYAAFSINLQYCNIQIHCFFYLVGNKRPSSSDENNCVKKRRHSVDPAKLNFDKEGLLNKVKSLENGSEVCSSVSCSHKKLQYTGNINKNTYINIKVLINSTEVFRFYKILTLHYKNIFKRISSKKKMWLCIRLLFQLIRHFRKIRKKGKLKIYVLQVMHTEGELSCQVTYKQH